MRVVVDRRGNVLVDLARTWQDRSSNAAWGGVQALPKENQDVSFQRLKMAAAGPRFVTIGEIIKKPEVKEVTVVKGEIKDVKIRCVCTDNRVGRLRVTEREERMGGVSLRC